MPTLVKTPKIPIERSNNFEVQEGDDGYNVKGAGVFHNVVMEMEGEKVQQAFCPFDLGEANVLLGVE